MSRILLMQLLPALVKEDLATFGAAMEAYQRYGFKLFELNTQCPLIAACIEFLRRNGGVGVGMSRWGPALYAFSYDLSHLQSKSVAWLAANGGGEAILTRANNVGFRQIVPALPDG